MEIRPFSLAEAEEICEDFEDLKDTEFSMQGTLYLIDAVLVSPHASEEKAAFFDSYLKEGNDAQPHVSDECDVIIVFCNAEDEQAIYLMGIRQFAAEKGIMYNFP